MFADAGDSGFCCCLPDWIQHTDLYSYGHQHEHKCWAVYKCRLPNRMIRFLLPSAEEIRDPTPRGVLPCGPGYLSAPPTISAIVVPLTTESVASKGRLCKPDDSLVKRPLRLSWGKILEAAMTLRNFLGLAIGFVIFRSVSHASASFSTTVVFEKRAGLNLGNQKYAKTAFLFQELEHW